MTVETSPRRVGPQVVFGFALATTALGTWGYRLHEPAAPASEHVYRALQLFVFESGDLTGAVPWQLEVARLAAPAATLASAVLAVLAMSSRRIDRLRARWRHGHVVVCGLGMRGAAAATALHGAGYEVVGVDVDPTAAGVRVCRRARIPVIVGDGREVATLMAAGLPDAAHLVVLTPALALTAEVALAAASLLDVHATTPPLTIHVEIADPHLAALLAALEISSQPAARWRLEALDLAGLGAKALLDEQAPWKPGAEHAHVVVVGSTPLAAAVGHEVERRWRRAGGPSDRLTVTRAVGDAGTASSVYVCEDDETVAIAAALDAVTHLPGRPVLVRLERARAMVDLLARDAPSLRAVSLDGRLLTPGVLLDSTVERIARALHDAYRTAVPPGDPAGVAWDELPESLRASSRAHAADVAEKLRSVGRVLVPGDDGEPECFDDQEVEQLAPAEHDRWVAERAAAGWTAGPRDPVARTTPYLVPWEDLPADVQDVDRRLARALPGILADAGLLLRHSHHCEVTP